jgi:tetratricopeptide (TPR) repeat protein
VPPFDREAALKAAEKALKLGKVDAAIAEYVKVVEAQPRDWNSANSLGDLYVRAKKIERGVEQYTRIADHLADEGFYAKALAIFKKILKLKPDHEYSLLQSGDLAAKLGTLADAKQFFTQVADKRKARGDKKGAAEVAIKLGTLDPEDLDARMRAAQLAGEMGDTATALREYREVAGKLKKADKHGDMLVPLQKAYDLDKADDGVRSQLFNAYLDTDPDAARKLA